MGRTGLSPGASPHRRGWGWGSRAGPTRSTPAARRDRPLISSILEIVVHCKMGGRSAKAVTLLRERGFTRVRNLKGGILAWIERVDASLTKY